MASEELIDSYVNRPAIADDTKFLIDQLKTVLDLLDKVNATKVTLGGAKSMKDVVDGAKEAQKATEELAKGKQKLIEVDLAAQKAAIAEKEAMRQRNAELKNQVREEQNVKGSIEQRRAALIRLQKEYDKLSPKERESSRGVRLEKTVADVTEQLKKLEGATGRFQRNVGNYDGSAKIIVDALERARQKFDQVSKAADSTPAAVSRARGEFEALRAVTDSKQFLSFAGKMGDAQAEVKTFTRVLVNLENQGEGNSEVAIELRKRLAELTDTIADTKDAVRALASDTRSFDLFAGAVNFAADAFQVAAGAAVAFGASEEEAAEATKTLLAIQTISNGVKGIATELTTKGTAANKAYAFAQNQVAIAMDTTATAGARLKAALITVGIGALIIGIGILIANFDKLKNALSGLSKQQILSKEITDKAIDSYIKEKVAVEQLVAEGQRETTSKKRKLEIIKELNEKSPVYFGHIRTEKDLQNEATEAVKKYVQAITLKARAQAAVELLAEKEKAVVLRQIELERQLEAAKTQTFDSEQRKQRHIKGLQDLIAKGTDITLIALQKQADPIRKVIATIQQELNNLGGDPNKPIEIPFVATKKARTGDSEAEAADLEKLSAIEDAHLIFRLAAREKAFEIRKEILAKEKAVELENLNAQIKAEEAKGVVDENKRKEFAQKRLDIVNDSNDKEKEITRAKDKDILAIRQSFIAKQREIEEQTNADFFKDQEDRFNKEIELLQELQEKRQAENIAGREIELSALNDWYQNRIEVTREGSKKREKVEQEYAERSADIEYRYALAALKTQIEFAKKVLALRKAAGMEVSQLSEEIAKLEIELSDLVTSRVVENNKRQTKSHQEKLAAVVAGIQKTKETYDQVTGIIGDLISASTDRQKNAIQEQIDAIDEKKEKEVEAINSSSLSEQEKADKLAIINVRAATQKEALERKQRQLDLQRARFEKAKAIGEIIINTALAVTKSLPNIPQAILMGVLGAAQLAVAIATPLPKFKSGRKDGPATMGVVGDGGQQEVIYSPDLKHAILTPDTDTLAFIPKGYGVAPSVEDFQEMAMSMAHSQVPVIPIIQNNNNDELIMAMSYSIGRLERAVMGKQETHFHWDNGELQKSIKNGNDWWRYIQNNI